LIGFHLVIIDGMSWVLRLFSYPSGSVIRAMPPNLSAAVDRLDTKPLRGRRPAFRSSEVVLLCVGFGLSSSLYVGGLGLRWPVLLTGLLPPLGVLVVWQKGQKGQQRSLSPQPQPTLLDAALLRQRLQLDADLPLAIGSQWRLVSARLEAVRALAVHCVELDSSCSVSLLVLLERLVDRATAVGSDLGRLSQAPTSGAQRLYSQRLEALQEHLQTCLDGLARSYDAALEDALRCPEIPAQVLLSTSLLQP
jgi:hypothetical protein